MVEPFIPDSEIERMFAQALAWEPDRVWRRSVQSLNRHEWAQAASQLLCLAFRYAFEKAHTAENETIDCILGTLEKLNQSERHGLYRACSVAAAKLSELQDDEPDPSLVHLMLVIIQGASQEKLVVVDMIRRLKLILKLEIKNTDVSLLSEKYRLLFEALPKLSQTDETASGHAFVELPPRNVRARDLERTFQLGSSPAKEFSTRFSKLHDELTEVTDKYGYKSAQVAKALADIVECSVAEIGGINVKPYLNELAQICSDENVSLNTYQIRRIYTIAGMIHDREALASMLEQIEEALFGRREKCIGYDIETAIALNRLIGLWTQTDNLKLGETFCRLLCERASKHLAPNDLALRHMQSAHAHVETILKNPSSKSNTRLRSVKYDEPTDFISMFCLLAMDLFNAQAAPNAALSLNEMLTYYNDCIGANGLPVSEMLWLLMETDARILHGFADKLIALSEKKITDVYLARRLDTHIRRLAVLRERDSRILSIDRDCITEFERTLSGTTRRLAHGAAELANSKVEANAEDVAITREVAQELIIRVADAWLIARAPERAIALLKHGLETTDPHSQSKAQMHMLLARAYVAAGDSFEATTNILVAYQIVQEARPNSQIMTGSTIYRDKIDGDKMDTVGATHGRSQCITGLRSCLISASCIIRFVLFMVAPQLNHPRLVRKKFQV